MTEFHNKITHTLVLDMCPLLFIRNTNSLREKM